jgi:hypothetical protein
MFWQIEDLIHEVLHFTPAQVQQQIIDIMVCQCVSTVEQLRRVTADDLRQLGVPLFAVYTLQDKGYLVGIDFE